MDDIDWDRVTRSNYRLTFGFPSNWVRKANALFDAAWELEDSVHQTWIDISRWLQRDGAGPGPSEGVVDIYFMLVGFGIENLFKARLTIDNRSDYEMQVREQGILPKDLKSHDLVGLAARAGLRCDLSEEDLLRRLTRCSEWAGRYPIPTKWSDSRSSTKFSDGKEYAVAWRGEHDPIAVRQLVNRIRTDLAPLE